MTEREKKRLAQWEACFPEYLDLEDLDQKRQGILLWDPLPTEIEAIQSKFRELQIQHPRSDMDCKSKRGGVPSEYRPRCVEPGCERTAWRGHRCRICWRKTLPSETCSRDGCEKKVEAKGLCAAHYQESRLATQRLKLAAIAGHKDIRP